jgi:DNA polymerase (family 10)
VNTELAQSVGARTALIRNLLSTGTLSASEATLLVRQLNVVTIADLGPAVDDGRVGRALGSAAAERLAEFLAKADPPAIALGRALDLGEELIAEFTSLVNAGTAASVHFEPAGDARRVDSIVSAVVLVARSPDSKRAIDLVASSSAARDVLHRSARRLVFTYRQTEIDIRVPAPDEYGSVLFAATGSRAHLAAMHARRRARPLCAREDQVYAEAGLAWIPPELREGTGEVEAAAASKLPVLIERRHIRGDLHMHSTFSDGRDTLETMIETASGLGYEYVAITDHSHTSAASKTLSVSDIPRQREAIARLRERYPAMAILHGVEVDILPNGRLDFDDEVLAQVDIVLASLHDRAGHDGSRLTRRTLDAILHPLVNVICHPENRVMGKREGYPLEFEAVYDAAAQTGTALEIDGAPGHLDLDGAHARAAAAAGATLVVDSDCHRAGALDRQMKLGVGIARRGWIEPAIVLNTRPLADVLAFGRATRRRGGW